MGNHILLAMEPLNLLSQECTLVFKVHRTPSNSTRSINHSCWRTPSIRLQSPSPDHCVPKNNAQFIIML